MVNEPLMLTFVHESVCLSSGACVYFVLSYLSLQKVVSSLLSSHCGALHFRAFSLGFYSYGPVYM